MIEREAAVDVMKNAAIIVRELREENLADISQSTVSRRLREVGLFGCIGVRKPFINKKNKKARLEFAKKHQSWTVEEWKKVLFRTKLKLIYLEMMVEDMFDDQKALEMILDIRYEQ